MFLNAYRQGAFPMADMPIPARRTGPIPMAARVRWYSPDPRAVLGLEEGALRVPRTIRRLMSRKAFLLSSDRAFERVIRACARPGPTRGGSWLDESLIRCYTLLHEMGHAHSIEAWKDSALIGGIYGISIGAAFFAESMYSDIELGGSGAAGLCLAALWGHLRGCGYELLDVQMANEYTLRFGVEEIPGAEYRRLLARAIEGPDRWRQLRADGASDSDPSGSGV